MMGAYTNNKIRKSMIKNVINTIGTMKIQDKREWKNYKNKTGSEVIYIIYIKNHK